MGGVVAVQFSCNDKALDVLAGPIGMILGVSTHHIEAGTGQVEVQETEEDQCCSYHLW
jgi:hypothetical protein